MKLLFDIETNGIDFSRGDIIQQAHTVHCLVIQDVQTKEITEYYDTQDGHRPLGQLGVSHGVRRLEEASELIGHNIIQFDLTILRALFNLKFSGRVTDTLVLSRLYHPDREGGHSLSSWGDRFGYPKGEFSDFDKFSGEMLEYCRRDVELNTKVYDHLRTDHYDWAQSVQLEHKFAQIITDQEGKGFAFDQALAVSLVKEWQEEVDDIDTFIHGNVGRRSKLGRHVKTPFKINGDLAKRATDIASEYGIAHRDICGPFDTFDMVPVNLNSKKEQKKLLLELGWKPREYTHVAGEPKIDSSILEVKPVGVKIDRRNLLTHRRGQVTGLMAYAELDGRVHGGGNPCGTKTGRMRHSRIVNIPLLVMDHYGKSLLF